LSSATRNLFPHELLLSTCVVACPDAETYGRMEATLSSPELDWPTTLKTAIRHGVAPLLAWRLHDFPADPRIPAAIRPVLERILKGQDARNAALFRATSLLTQALAQAGIPCLTLKGVGLALAAYPEPALRCFSDIDLLVPEADWERAGQVAREIGFLPGEEQATPQDYHLSYRMRVEEDLLSETLVPEFEPKHRPEALGEAAHQITVEIHRSVFIHPGGFGRDVEMDPFWKAARTVTLPDGNPIRIPAPEAMLVHLAAHAAHHNYWRLYFMADMIQVIRTWGAEMDWERVCDFADRYGALDAVYRMLEGAHREYAAPVPEDALRKLQARTTCPPLELTEIFAAMELGRHELSAMTWTLLLKQRSPWRALASAGRILFPAPSIMERYYGVRSPLLLAGCYLIRPLQLAGRLARVLSRIAGTHLQRAWTARSVSLRAAAEITPAGRAPLTTGEEK